MMSISGIYALTNQTPNGIFSTGRVDIKIQTYQINEQNEEIAYEEPSKRVAPGDVISLIPKIVNLGENCYVRFKVDYVDENTDFVDYSTGISNNFKKYGEYYYYNKVFTKGETIKIFETIKIPNDIKEKMNGKKIKLEIQAQAIQEKNFEPDYTVANPWKNIEPTETINDSYDIDTDRNYSKIAIKYENNTNKDVTVPDDFGKNLKNSMPGDIYTDIIEIKNNSKAKAKYYLRFDNKQKNSEETELLNKVILTITNQNGQVIYDGNLLLKEKILLGEYNSEEYDKLEYKITIPSELGNEYANLNPEILLIFSADYDEKQPDEEQPVNNDEKKTEDYSNKNTSDNPKTGDSINLAMTVFLISAIGLIIVMLLNYILKKKNTDNSI